MAADPTQERIEGPTPNGGRYSIAYFFDAARKSVPKDRATGMEVVEFNDKDDAIHRTYMTRRGGGS
jgi:hypothetical protein